MNVIVESEKSYLFALKRLIEVGHPKTSWSSALDGFGRRICRLEFNSRLRPRCLDLGQTCDA